MKCCTIYAFEEDLHVNNCLVIIIAITSFGCIKDVGLSTKDMGKFLSLLTAAVYKLNKLEVLQQGLIISEISEKEPPFCDCSTSLWLLNFSLSFNRWRKKTFMVVVLSVHLPLSVLKTGFAEESFQQSGKQDLFKCILNRSDICKGGISRLGKIRCTLVSCAYRAPKVELRTTK